ncbi:MAG: sigma 54-interacting transcriptional regulator [Planctomycetota bacterium]|nr:sigma 54-interacting transcriptional regulator [Planctomycetota bacterium]
MSYSLVVLNGTNSGSTLRLDGASGVVTIGRHISNDLQLDDDKASRMHSRISLRGDRWHIEDCDSLNGTHVNSQPIEQSLLEPGDLIRIGDRLILFVDNTSDEGSADVQTSVFRATTMAGRHQDLQAGGGLVEQSVSDSMSRIVRDSAVLCRLANLLHQHSDVEVLIRSAIDALVDGIDADAVSFWLVAADGRLRCAGRWGDVEEKHLLASLAVEKSQAILIDHADNSDNDSVTDSPASVGLALGVPIPGPQTCRGAIECHRSEKRGPFSRSDLDFSVVVAHQAGLALENLEHRERLELANAELRRRLSSQNKLVGSSAAMKQVIEQIGRVGPASSTVLILGESGTGKELVARSIHDMSRYSAGPYVTVNCAAFNESLLESELFGHEVGAFTGADRRYIGQFERANRGTLFLDEVGEMSLACQAKLLRVLEGHPFQRLGGAEEINVDVRMIAATHRNLPEMIEQHHFREDLYYRLRVIDIKMPPLRDRDEDVIELAAMFVESFRSQMGRGPLRLSRAAMDALHTYRWPGNVRELKNAVERAVVLGQGEEMEPSDLGLPTVVASNATAPQMMTLKEAEERHIKFVLDRCGGNKTQACKVLGIGRATLYSKLGSE